MAAWYRATTPNGVYDVVWWPGAERDTAAIAERNDSLGVGLAGASLVALAGRLGTTEIATLDERQFRTMRPAEGGAFRVLPRGWS